MTQSIYQVLTKAEMTIDMSIEDEQLPERLPSALLYRKVRQCVYGILFDLSSKKKKDDKFDPTSLSVKEWCVYGGRRLNDPDLVEPMALDWDVPPVDKLWFSKGATADSNRLKAFLSCMMSNTPSMTQTVIVPKRLVILCCILRYCKLNVSWSHFIIYDFFIITFCTVSLQYQSTCIWFTFSPPPSPGRFCVFAIFLKLFIQVIQGFKNVPAILLFHLLHIIL